MCDLYRTYCVEEGCRVNSAVMQYIESSGARFPLEKLVLDRNYLGPQGLRPIIRLVEYCQTLTQLNLDGNGADNETVRRLCAVLEKHTGVESLSLRGNPITVTGGKYVLSLVERNPRILDVNLSETDVFDALIHKVNKAVEANRRRASWATPRLVVSEVSGQQVWRGRTGSAVARLSIDKPMLTTFPAITQGASGNRVSSRREDPPQCVSGVPELTKPQPRPPIPALASKDSTRLPEARRRELQQRYIEKALLFCEISGNQASRAADRARGELMLMERSTQSPISCKRRELATATGRRSLRTAQISLSDVGEAPSAEGDADAHLLLPRSVLHDEESGPRSRSGSEPTMGSLDLADGSRKKKKRTGSDQVSKDAMDGVDATAPVVTPAEPAEAGSVGVGTTSKEVTVGADDNENMPLDVLLESPQWTVLDSSAQFQQLFDCGCRAYARHDFDAAYTAWNEAMGIAVNKKNREWMTVLSSNLQRLSYEMLVREGVEKLEHDCLEEADLFFQRALEVAQKARNAAWEADMQKARRDVQNAVFQHCHESALKIFERAQQLPAQTVTDDDYFVVPGTDVLTRHTESFVNEWPRMLLVKEAVEIWASTRRVIERIGGSAGRALQKVVVEALDSVACFLAKRCFDTHDPQSLSWMHTSLYHYQECIMLNTLWTDMSSCDKFTEHHKLFAAVAAAQIGNFYLATYQLDDAQTQFDTLEALAGELGDPFLRAAGHTFSALVNWQRARYSVAESQLRLAVLEWGTLREAATASQREDEKTESDSEAGDDSGKNDCCSRLFASLPSDHIAVMERASLKYLVTSIANMYRYGEALEVLERSLVCKYRDMLFEKMKVNFNSQPTLEHIVAISSQIRSPFIYQLVAPRYDWSTEEKRYTVDEKLLMWVVPQSNEMRFVEVGVTKDFKVSSVHDLIEELRRELLLDPLPTSSHVQNDIMLKLPERAWVEPLQTLHAILVDPVVEFLRALNPLFLSKNGVITIIPTERLWLVPFNALIARSGSFLVEDFAVQMAFCATQCAFSAMSARRVQQRDLHRDVVLVQRDVETPAMHLLSNVAFPFDPLRSTKEGELVMQTMAQHKRSIHHSRRNTSSVTVMSSEVLVDDLDALRALLPKSRTVHISTSTTSAVQNEESSAGAICVAVSQNEISLLRSSEIARMKLFAELVVMSNTNISTSRVVGTHDDVLGLIRAFFGSGVPCVIAGQWCTPDMVPSELFLKFYQLLSEANKKFYRSVSSYGATTTARTTLTTTTTPPLPRAAMELKGPRDSDAADEFAAQDTANCHCHKALLLARAIRALLEESFFRYSPRTWAGYCCVGYGFPQ